MAKPDMDMPTFLTIASTWDHDDPRIWREGWGRYSEESRKLRMEERYGADWGNLLVMHTGDHEDALEVLLGRKPKQLEVWDSASGKVIVAATGTTGMGTISAAKDKRAAQDGGSAEIAELRAKLEEARMAVTASRNEVMDLQGKLRSIDVLVKEYSASIPSSGGGQWVAKLRDLTSKIRGVLKSL